MTVSPQLLRLAEKLRNSQAPPHHSCAQTALSYERFLTEGERWFLRSILCLSSLSERQWVRLREIEAKAERSR
jgi:hypothetical protein